MAIYGTALLSFCLLAGLVIGQFLGEMLGIGKNVGGVGIAMLLLILLSDRLRRSGYLPTPTQQGVLFWSSIYIPIVVAMAAGLDVRGAIKGGPLAILAGVLAVVICLALVPLLSGGGDADSQQEDS
ncbi:MAG: malonate transporter subunit MadL [Rubripirellula sp.]